MEYIFREGMGAKRVVRVWVSANVAVLGGLVERREEGGKKMEHGRERTRRSQ